MRNTFVNRHFSLFFRKMTLILLISHTRLAYFS